tara:strand:- start:82175 stop:82615 length:441 start_codon:yes stop_codon:yes gene_type:complete
MASLISDSEKQNLVKIFTDVFDTFKREIVVHKEPIKIVNQINLTAIFGYDEFSNETNYTYETSNKTIYAIVRYADNHGFADVDNNTINLIKGDVSIKVNKEGRDYINTGKTEKIEIDGKAFNVDGQEIIQRFLDSEYYIFNLKLTS